MILYHLFLVSVSIGLGNFAASIGIGMGGVDGKLRLKIALIFGFFEGFMPVLGLLIGQEISRFIGHFGNYIGAALLILSGLYTLLQVRKRSANQYKEERTKIYELKTRRLILMGFVLGIDNTCGWFCSQPLSCSTSTNRNIYSNDKHPHVPHRFRNGKVPWRGFEEWSEVAGKPNFIFVGLGRLWVCSNI